MGVVYRALDPRSGRRVALKLLHDTSERFRARFQREAELLARLRHPHVVGVHGAGEVGGKPYLVMELIEGESLRDRIHRSGRLRDQEAARLTAEVARGAGHAHAAGLVHRDIKPANVLLTSGAEGQRALLTDFGLARDLAVESDLSKTGVFLGTPGYASPEQAAGRRELLSPASDVYGLGGLLYDALTGAAPNEGTNLIEVLCATLEGPVASPRERHADVHPDLDAICRACLAKDPRERYPDGDALAEDLERFLRGESPQGIPAPRRRFPLSGLLVGLGVLSTVALGAALWGASGEAPAGPGLAAATPTPTPTPTTSPTPPAGSAGKPDSGLIGALRLTGRLRREAEELGRGIRLLEEALERSPANATNRGEGRARLAELYAQRADLAIALRPHEAVSDLRRAYALDESPARRAALGEAALQSGLVHSSQNRLADAWVLGQPLLEEAIRLLPGDPRPYRALGEQARAHRDFTAAMRGYRGAVRLDPSAPELYHAVLNLCAKAGRWTEAREVFEGWARDHPQVAVAHVTLGSLHQRRARFAAARRAYERALELDPQHPGAHVGLGFVALEEERPSVALEHAELAARASGGLRDFRLALRGVALSCQGRHEEALGDLEAGLRCSPLPRRVGESLLNALHWVRGGGKELAALQERRGLKELPRGRDKMLWADYYWRRGEHRKAFEALRAGRRLDPDDPDVCLAAARRKLSWGMPHDPRGALNWLKAASGTWPDDEESRYLVEGAVAFTRLFQYERSAALLARAKQEHPTRHSIWKNEADLCNRTEDYPRAIKAGLKAMELEPNDGYAMALLSDAYQGVGQPQEALKWLERASERLPKNGAILISRGLARYDTGDLEGARADLEQARKDRDTLGRHEFKLLEAYFAARAGELTETIRADLKVIAADKKYRWAQPRAQALLRGE